MKMMVGNIFSVNTTRMETLIGALGPISTFHLSRLMTIPTTNLFIHLKTYLKWKEKPTTYYSNIASFITIQISIHRSTFLIRTLQMALVAAG